MQNNVICLVVDRLHTGMLGAYGNSWIKTAALDQLASESFVFDQAFVDNPQLDRLYQAYWFGHHGDDELQSADAPTSLPRLLAQAGLHTALVTDESAVADMSWADDFAEKVLGPRTPDDQSASDVSETALARLFGTAIEWLSSPRQPFFLWIHARGMTASWDAPLELRQQFADDEDPQPPAFTAVPDYWLSDKYDPDEVLGIRHAYAGQVAALDMCTGAFLEEFEARGLARNTLLTFLSARGFPLGEHRRVGSCDEALYNELVQLAWWMRFPDETGRLQRSQALIQPSDLPGTLLDWLELDRSRLARDHASSLMDIVRGRSESLRDRILMRSAHDRAIRTPAWSLRQPGSGTAELYAKPGDRWEVNEVSKLLPDIVLGLQAALTETAAAGHGDLLAPLDEALVREVD